MFKVLHVHRLYYANRKIQSKLEVETRLGTLATYFARASFCNNCTYVHLYVVRTITNRLAHY